MQDSGLTVTVELESSHGSNSYANITFDDISTSWQRYTATLTAKATDTTARLAVKLKVLIDPRFCLRPMCSPMLLPERVGFEDLIWVQRDKLLHGSVWELNLMPAIAV